MVHAKAIVICYPTSYVYTLDVIKLPVNIWVEEGEGVDAGEVDADPESVVTGTEHIMDDPPTRITM